MRKISTCQSGKLEIVNLISCLKETYAYIEVRLNEIVKNQLYISKFVNS